MNNLQKIVSNISGYDGLDESGACNDYYYDLKTQREKIDLIKSYGLDVEGIDPVSELEAVIIYTFLESDFFSQDDQFHEFKNLGDEKWDGTLD